MKQCTKCKTSKPLTDFYVNRSRSDNKDERCKSCKLENQRAYRNTTKGHAAHKRSMNKHIADLKEAVFVAYGGFLCACCGETEKKFLSIDHLYGGGTAHRKIVGTGQSFHRWLKKNGYPEGYQILCFNCNWGKYLNNGVCPHKDVSHV